MNEHQPIKVTLDEESCSMLKDLTTANNEASAAVGKKIHAAAERTMMTIMKAVQAQMEADIKAAVQADPACKVTTQMLIDGTNRVLDKLQGELPEGYAVTNINFEEHEATAEFKPDFAGKRLSDVE